MIILTFPESYFHSQRVAPATKANTYSPARLVPPSEVDSRLFPTFTRRGARRRGQRVRRQYLASFRASLDQP